MSRATGPNHEESNEAFDVEGPLGVSQTDSQPPTLTALIDSVFSDSPTSLDFGRFLLTHEVDGNQFQLSSFGMPESQENPVTPGFDGSDWNMYGLEELLRGTGMESEHENESSTLQQPRVVADREMLHLALAESSDAAGRIDRPSMLESQATAETIQHMFENRTCEILSIKEDQTRNPWRTLIWPLAAKCPALYHALAAMACLHICKLQPRLRLPGIQHFDNSVEALARDNNLTPETTIATRLALALAASWDYERSPTVIEHVSAARTLVQQAGSKERASNLPPVELSRLSFLANTCLYMDVIARLVCVKPLSFNNLDFMMACSNLSSSIPSKQQLDPLMGCAITLFPMIGQLAELVGRVRQRSEKRNSPAIISKAAELRVSIERWAPTIDPGDSAELNSNLIDSIQTAEAYRWASLLLLRQAVPELPWKHSIWELASKSLVFLATIPLSSRTTIVQIFPLMLAGCEAVDEDRPWVRERWDLMSKSMITGIVDRCRDITLEVWRRRDEYEVHNGGLQQSPIPMEKRGTMEDGVITEDSTPESEARTTRSLSKKMRQRSNSLDFPESAAFKKGIDPVTRAGHLHYTVRGNLHCFAVMTDRDWHGMSCFRAIPL
ncbi:hypothetical protein H2200_000809 [Cladophialophora chaetospira]|uniref:Uncharacterized protein n=1 Tax=Cladophialophora chaetospira TaxID=386627 RepID=A0AA38XP65_9EURO|nr:hypothetical protein H2200_000809 [Cladophialophora chaetospira]